MSAKSWIVLFFLITTIIGVVRLNKKVKTGETNNNALTSFEKIFTVLAGIAFPLVAVNGIIYYSLRKKYPIKAKQANKIGWITLLIAIAIDILYTMLTRF